MRDRQRWAEIGGGRTERGEGRGRGKAETLSLRLTVFTRSRWPPSFVPITMTLLSTSAPLSPHAQPARGTPEETEAQRARVSSLVDTDLRSRGRSPRKGRGRTGQAQGTCARPGSGNPHAPLCDLSKAGGLSRAVPGQLGARGTLSPLPAARAHPGAPAPGPCKAHARTPRVKRREKPDSLYFCPPSPFILVETTT